MCCVGVQVKGVIYSVCVWGRCAVTRGAQVHIGVLCTLVVRCLTRKGKRFLTAVARRCSSCRCFVLFCVFVNEHLIGNNKTLILQTARKGVDIDSLTVGEQQARTDSASTRLSDVKCLSSSSVGLSSFNVSQKPAPVGTSWDTPARFKFKFKFKFNFIVKNLCNRVSTEV